MWLALNETDGDERNDTIYILCITLLFIHNNTITFYTYDETIREQF